MHTSNSTCFQFAPLCGGLHIATWTALQSKCHTNHAFRPVTRCAIDHHSHNCPPPARLRRGQRTSPLKVILLNTSNLEQGCEGCLDLSSTPSHCGSAVEAQVHLLDQVRIFQLHLDALLVVMLLLTTASKGYDPGLPIRGRDSQYQPSPLIGVFSLR